MKTTVTIFVVLTVFSITAARPQGLKDLIPNVTKLAPGGLDVTKLVPGGLDVTKQMPDFFKLFSGFSNFGPSNYDTSSTNVNTGVQTASNQGSTNSSNKNSGYNIASKVNLERSEVAQDHGRQSAYLPPPPPPPPLPEYE